MLKNKHPLQYDAVITVPFGAVGISVQGVQVAIELLSQKHAKKTAENKTAEIAGTIEFQRNYFRAMQQSPEVVVAHSEFAKVLGPARLSKEVH